MLVHALELIDLVIFVVDLEHLVALRPRILPFYRIFHLLWLCLHDLLGFLWLQRQSFRLHPLLLLLLYLIPLLDLLLEDGLIRSVDPRYPEIILLFIILVFLGLDRIIDLLILFIERLVLILEEPVEFVQVVGAVVQLGEGCFDHRVVEPVTDVVLYNERLTSGGL